LFSIKQPMKIPVHKHRSCFTICVASFMNHSRLPTVDSKCSSVAIRDDDTDTKYFLVHVSYLEPISSRFFSASLCFLYALFLSRMNPVARDLYAYL
jgi:hypothetical protein